MKKMRISYSLLSLWEKGDVDGAISTYFHLDRPITKQMKEGKEIHEKIAKHIDEHKEFPEWFFSWELKEPVTEKVITVPYNEQFDLKCIVDCLDTPYMFEYKTGVTNSLGWTRTDQLPFYFLCCELAEIPVDTAFLVRYNQHVDKTDYAVVHNNLPLREHARNIIDSYAPEIYEFFSKEGLL